MEVLNAKNRIALTTRLGAEQYDLLVIGGGITGAGIALDAAARGIKTALVEKQDFAGGTSSRSTKLIHGGLRYLAQGELMLVQEVGKERAILHNNAPHLVIPEKMLLPIVEGGTYGKVSTFLGLTIYDALAAVKNEERKTQLSKKKVLEAEPLLNNDIIKGGFLYSEYRTDDARLTLSVLKTAVHHGAVPANYIEVKELLYENKKICGASCTDVLTSNPLRIVAKQIVNAAGPWVDEVRKKDGSITGKTLHHTKGIHLVVGHDQLPVKDSIYFDAFDGRMIFAIPRGRITYIGTTDTDYKGVLDNPKATLDDVTYLLKAVNKMFPTAGLQTKNIISSWAGIRPLIHEEGKNPSEISRKDEIFVSDSGMISIAGGKLTGFRKMASRTTDKVMENLHAENGFPKTRSNTRDIVLQGGAISNLKELIKETTYQLEKLGLANHEAKYLVHTYGTESKGIIKEMMGHLTSHPIADLSMAELRHCIQNESVHHLSDFVVQRTGRLYFDIGSIPGILDTLAETMGSILGWDEKQIIKEKETVKELIIQATDF